GAEIAAAAKSKADGFMRWVLPAASTQCWEAMLYESPGTYSPSARVSTEDRVWCQALLPLAKRAPANRFESTRHLPPARGGSELERRVQRRRAARPGRIACAIRGCCRTCWPPRGRGSRGRRRGS